MRFDPDEVRSHRWYLVTDRRGGDVVHGGTIRNVTRVGQRRLSLTVNGFQLFQNPRDISFYSAAHVYHPWTIWRVIPYRGGYVPSGPGHDRTRLYARAIWVTEKMPAGFEFGAGGHNVQGLLDHLASSACNQQLPKLGTLSDYGRAYHDLLGAVEDAPGYIDLVHGHDGGLRAFADDYLKEQCSRIRFGAHYNPYRREHQQIWPFHQHVQPIVDASLLNVPIPRAVVDYWNLPGHRRRESRAMAQRCSGT